MRLRSSSFAFFSSTTTTTMSTWRPTSCPTWRPGGRRSGYTLVEILVAMTLTLMLMTAVVTVFGGVGDGIAKSRRAMEQFDRLRTTAQQLRQDLQGLTVKLDGRPVRPEENQGYFEYIEGGIMSIPQQLNVTSGTPYSNWIMQAGTPQATWNISSGTPQAVNDQLLTTSGSADLTVGERGDILMFTTRNASRPFLGRYVAAVDPTNPTLQSDVAEVAWFLRGKTLHRRVLLVAPGTAQALQQYYQSYYKLYQNPYQFQTFYANNDISAHLVTTYVNGTPVNIPVPNSLGDLTKRENRFAHPVDAFPFNVRRWGLLGLPTLAECTSFSYQGPSQFSWMTFWVNGTTPLPTIASTPPSSSPFYLTHPPVATKWQPQPPASAGIVPPIDMWDSGNIAGAFVLPAGTSPDQYLDQQTQDATRLADDVILTNVIGFDVKVWEPAANNGAGGYVDLGYWGNPPVPSVGPAIPGFPPIQLQNYVLPPATPPLSPAVVPQNPMVPRFQHPGIYALSLAVAPQYLYSLVAVGDTPSYPNYPYPYRFARVYDSGCSSYENEGLYHFTFDAKGNPKTAIDYSGGQSTNGLDDPVVPPDNNLVGPPGVPNQTSTKPVPNGIVDDASECINSMPYPVPLRGIQITIRCYEPDSRQIRQITIEHDFLPK